MSRRITTNDIEQGRARLVRRDGYWQAERAPRGSQYRIPMQRKEGLG